ncbi:MAG: CapA family protein [bacterium]|nr:CapA family protein [bacterium]
MRLELKEVMAVLAFLLIFFAPAFFGVEDISLPERRPRGEVLFSGDIMLGRNVEVLMKRFGSDYPFEKIQAVLSRAVGVVGNLEGPIPEVHVPTPSGSTRFSFASSTVGPLERNNFSVLSLGNNHTLDYGDRAHERTVSLLSDRGIASVGHAVAIDSRSYVRRAIGGMPFVFFSFNATYPVFSADEATGLVAKESDPHTFSVVLMHWGEEYSLRASEKERALARSFIDQGADLIIGHHPHVVQGIDMYKDRPIFHSLGNFIFDQYFSQDVEEGLLVRLRARGTSGLSYELMPLQSIRSQPMLMTEPERSAFLSKLAERSNQSIRQFIVKGILTVPSPLVGRE